MWLFLKEQLEQNERIALLNFSNTRAICSLWKSNSLFLRVLFAPFWRENWKLDLYHTFWLCSRLGLCSLRSFQKERKELFALLKRAKKQFTLFCQKNKRFAWKTKDRSPWVGNINCPESAKLCSNPGPESIYLPHILSQNIDIFFEIFERTYCTVYNPENHQEGTGDGWN